MRRMKKQKQSNKGEEDNKKELKKQKGILSFLCNRELGKNSPFDCPSDISQRIVEEKSTIPIVNKACDLAGHSRSTFLVSFSSDRTLIASSHGDHSVRVTESKTGKTKTILKGHPRTPWSIAFHPVSNDILASGCLGGVVRIWDLRGGGCEIWKSDDGRVIGSLAFHPRDQLLVIATLNEVVFWDWSKPEPFAKCKTSTNHERIRWCKFDPFGNFLYTGIANPSTIPNHDLYSNGAVVDLPPVDAGGAADQGHLWEQYRRVVDEINAHQRERIQRQHSFLRDRNIDPMLQDDIAIDEPTAPQYSALRSAQRYAAQMTRASLDQSRSATSSNLPHIEIGRVEGPSAPDFGNTEEHMQQIHRIPNIYASTTEGLDTLAQAAETVSQMDSSRPDSRLGLPGESRGRLDPGLGLPGESRGRSDPGLGLPGESRDRSDPGLGLSGRSRGQSRSRFGFSSPPVMSRYPVMSSSSNLRRPHVSTYSCPCHSDRSDPSNPSFSYPIFRRGQTSSSQPLTQSTLERFLSTNSHSDAATSNVDLNFLSEINVSGLNTGTTNSVSTASSPTTEDSGSGARFNVHPPRESSTSHRDAPAVPRRSSSSSLYIGTVGPPVRGSAVCGGNVPHTSVTSGMARIARSAHLSRLSSHSTVYTSASVIPTRNPMVNTSASVIPTRNPTVVSVRPRLILPTAQLRPNGSETLPGAITQRPLFQRISSETAPPRDRSLMTLLEAPLPSTTSLLGGASSVTNVPQPEAVPPVSQSPFSYMGRNWDIQDQAPQPANPPVSFSPSDFLRQNLDTPDWPQVPVYRVSPSDILRQNLDIPDRPPAPVPTISPSAFMGRSSSIRECMTRADATVGRRPEPHLSCQEENCQVCIANRFFANLNELDIPNQPPPPIFADRSRAAELDIPNQPPPPIFTDRAAFYSNLDELGCVSIPTNMLPDVITTSNLSPLSFTTAYNSSTATVSIVTPTPTSIITPISTVSTIPVTITTNSGFNENSLTTGNRVAITTVSGLNENSSATGGQSRQPQRLATIIETEVRDAINRIRSHEVDISHTLRGLDSLQRNLGVETSADTESASGASSNVEEPPPPAQMLYEPPQPQMSDEAYVEVDVTSDELNNNNMGTALEVTVENSPGAGTAATTSEGLLAISNISSVLGERIQQLDERVNNIQSRLRESMQELDRQNRSSSRTRRMRASARLNERRMQRYQNYQRHRARLQFRELNTSPSMTRMTSRLQQINAQQILRESRMQERRDNRNSVLQRTTSSPRFERARLLDDTAANRTDYRHIPMHRTSNIMSSSETLATSNIVNLTHRIQRWNLDSGIPDVTQVDKNLIVRSCKLHNDATVDISQDGRLLATFVSTSHGFPDDTVLGVFSLQSRDLGDCLYTKSFGPNAISLSISPLSNYVLVGLAAKRLQWVFAPKQMVAQIYKFRPKFQGRGEDSMEHICDLMHPCDLDLRVHVSVNSARWLPGVGEGVAYCTNRGDLHICKPGYESKSMPPSDNGDERQNTYTRQLVMQLLRINSLRTNTSSTQTGTQGVRRTASTQTDQVASDSE